MPFVHFFVSSQVLVSQPDFFLEHARQTIVLTNQVPRSNLISNFRTLNTSASEHELVKIILSLHQWAHGKPDMSGFHHGDIPETDIMGPSVDISPREAEVLALVARGFLNKEIADRLCISLPTVISHRKNICEKLHLRSVSSLTIYAVTHGIVNIEEV
jgi:DNA-binding NarL/FixJ family response regulator